MRHLAEITAVALKAITETESPIEAILFREMMRTHPFVLCKEDAEPVGEGYFIFPQYPVGPYRPDFLIKGIGYASNARVWPPVYSATIVVECDGKEFHSTPEQVEYDRKRDQWFKDNGIKTLRFSGAEIHRNVKFCVQQIAFTLNGEMKNG